MRIEKSFSDCVRVRDDDTGTVITIQEKSNGYIVQGVDAAMMGGPYRALDEAIRSAGGIVATVAARKYIRNMGRGPEVPSWIKAVG